MQKKFKICIIFVFCLIWGISCLHPVFPDEQLLQHSATFFALVLMIYFTKTNGISDLSFLLFACFMVLHILGARWIYTYVPYDRWGNQLIGHEISEFFGWRRNQYDRIVHLSYGLLLYIPVKEILFTYAGMTRKQSIFFAFEFILASSLIYELFEWSLTFLMSPVDADNYNGQQGDLWDAQKDMALAAGGGFIMMVSSIIKLLFMKER